MSSWTQALCAGCWPAWTLAQGRTPNEPTRMLATRETETCVACRQETTDGIYVRCDPKAYEPWHAVADAPSGGDGEPEPTTNGQAAATLVEIRKLLDHDGSTSKTRLLRDITSAVRAWEVAPAAPVDDEPLELLLASLVARGEGPWLMIRPYDTGNFGVHAYTPSDQHDSYDEIAYGKGTTLALAAAVVYARLAGVPVCAWCHAIESDTPASPSGWSQHASGAWTCGTCAAALFEEPAGTEGVRSDG